MQKRNGNSIGSRSGQVGVTASALSSPTVPTSENARRRARERCSLKLVPVPDALIRRLGTSELWNARRSNASNEHGFTSLGHPRPRPASEVGFYLRAQNAELVAFGI